MANGTELTRLSLTFPSNRALDVMEKILDIQQDLQLTGEDVQVDMVRNATLTPRRREADIVVPVEGDTVERVTGTTRKAARKAADTTIATKAGRNTVVYRVIDAAKKVNPREQEVRMYLLKKGKAESCAEIMAGTGYGLKVVQSALWGLRNKKAAESVEDTGSPIPQAKFSKAQIKAGAEA